MSKLSGRTIQAKYIEVHGQFGEFNVSNKKVRVRYFSTFASSKNKLHDSYSLLKELKPMRERVKAKDISSLNSLLQRDLNDYRVAHELIPYLTTEKSPIAFFPAILAVLIPKGFIGKNEETEYPTPVTSNSDEENTIITYDDLWKLEIFKISEKESTLGILSIDPTKVDIVVLDGQHRANAFRVVTGTFTDEKNIYSTFYKDISPIPDFNADLPVTIIWFDNDKPTFDPKIVSRRLFVDLNNTSKKVSQSRTILLDEYEIPSLLTRFFYSKLANERQFMPNKFSLFHSDFDLDSDINVSSNNVFAITNPQILYDIFSWLTLGRTYNYNDLNKYSVGREAFRDSLQQFGKIFKHKLFSERDISSDEETSTRKRVVLKDVYKIDDFEAEYNIRLSPVMFNIYSNFNLFQRHFEATSIVEHKYSNSEMDHVSMSVWEEIFLGGEGLYYTFKDQNLKSSRNSVIEKYLKAIAEIETDFKKERANLFTGIDPRLVNAAYSSANTKAFQIGLFIALDYYCGDDNILDCYEDFLQLINAKSEKDWVYILTEIKQEVIPGGIDPKRWPAYQKLILRAIQNDRKVFYTNQNYRDSPDCLVFDGILKNSFDSWIEINEDVIYEDLSIESIGVTVVNKWIINAKEETVKLFRLANIEPLDEVDYTAIGKIIINEKIRKLQ